MKEKIKKILFIKSDWFSVIFIIIVFIFLIYLGFNFDLDIVELNKIKTNDLVYILGTLILAILALFGNQIRSCLFRPRLRFVQLKSKKTSQSIGNKNYTYQRFIVKNARKRWFSPFLNQAKDVRVLLTYVIVPENFIPIPLHWTHFDRSASRDIPPHEEAYVDVLCKQKGEKYYHFCWSPGTGSTDSVLDKFNPGFGNIRLEFFGHSGRIGDIELKYKEPEDILEVVA